MVTYMRGISESIAKCTAYAGTDYLLGPALIFIDIQSNGIVTSHIYTIAGYKYYSPLVMNHTNPAYQSALSHLPVVKQGSELYRGFAITIMKFFTELPNRLQWAIQDYNLQNDKGNKSYESWSVIPAAFEGQHAADLASRMYQVENPKFVYDLIEALSMKTLPWMDLDLVIRGGSFQNEEDFPKDVKRIIDMFGESTSLPTNKLQRASTMFSHSRHKSFVENRDPAVLEREVAEMVSTERNYVTRMASLMNDLVFPMRQTAQKIGGRNAFPTEAELAGLFPPSLDEIVELNTDFAAEVEDVFEQEGVEGVARVCLEYFPSFKSCYEDYMRASPNFTQLYSLFGKNRNSLFAKMIEGVGEQQFKSWLIEPVQRLPRYSLYIDNMLNHVEIFSELFKSLNQARDIISDICSLKGSDSTERSQTATRLQGMIPSWPAHLKPSGRLITAVDFYEILPPYNTQTSESLASILLLFPDCVVLLRRPKSTTLVARGIMAEVDRPPSMRMPSASKKEGLDLVFAGWCNLSNARFFEGDMGAALWMDHDTDLMDNWAKGGEAGFRKFILMNAYERRAKKFIEEVALARQEFRCGNNPPGLVGMRYQAEEASLSSWSAVWGNEYEGYRVSPSKGHHVVFIGEQPGSLQGSLETELEDGYEIVIGIEPASPQDIKLEIHARGYCTVHIIKDSDFKQLFSAYVSDCFIEMNSMEYETEARPAVFSFNERLLRSLSVSYDGHVSRLTRKLRPPSPVKLLSQVFGSSAPGAGNSVPTKLAKPVLNVGERTKLPPPGSAMHGMSRADSTDAAQKITLVKDDADSLGTPGIEGFMRLEKLVEVYIQGLRTAMDGFGFNLMADPERVALSDEDYREKAIEAHGIYVGFVKFLREEWSQKNQPMVGRQGLEKLCVAYEKTGPDWATEFFDFFSRFLDNMAPQNRRAFKNIIFFLNEAVTPLPSTEQSQVYPAFVNLFHLEEVDEDNINYDARYIRMIAYLSINSEELFDDSPRSLDVSAESTPIRETRTRRSNTLSTVNVGAANTWKKTLKQVTGSIRGDASNSKQKGQDEHIGRVASVLRTISKKDRSRLLTSKSVDEGMGNNATIKPLRPRSSDRPLLNTTFMSLSKESISATYPLETIVASPTGAHNNVIGTLPPPVKRKKRRSSLSDLKVPKISGSEIEAAPATSTVALLYDDIPVRPAAPAPQADYFGPITTFAPPRPRTDTGSSTNSNTELVKSPSKRAPNTALSDYGAPEPSVSPSPSQRGNRDRTVREKKDSSNTVSRKPVPRPTSRISSNNTPRQTSSDRTLRAPPASKKLRERASADRAAIHDAEALIQRQLGLISEELRKTQRSRGAYPTAPASVASSTSSTNSNNSNSGLGNNLESDIVKNLQSVVLGVLSDLKSKYEDFQRETSGELLQKEEHIKDQSIKLAQKDLEIQTLKNQLSKANNELKAKDALIKTKDAEIKKVGDENWTNINEVKQKSEAIRLHVEDARKKEETIRTLNTEVARLEAEVRLNQSKSSNELRRVEKKLAVAIQREEQHEAELKEKDRQINEINATAAKREEEHKAELRKRDRAMKGLNKLYEDLNLEQDELFKRCNDELEKIARAAAPNGFTRNGEDLWKCLDDTRLSEASMRQTIARLRRENVRLKARIEDNNSPGNRTPG